MGEPRVIIEDEVRRIFTVDGVKYSSVTEVLEAEGFIDTSYFTDRAADDGTRRHTITQLDDVDDLASCDITDMPYLEAWRRCKLENVIRIVEIEVRRYNHLYQYCGKPDRLAWFQEKLTILDIKTGAKMPWHMLQLAGYMGLYDNVFQGIDIYLRDNGTYVLGKKAGRKDRDDFLTIMRTHNLRTIEDF